MLIGDCCRELTDAILPALTDETLRLRLVMTETVLRNAAVRAAHEIAWMLAETSALVAYAADGGGPARKRAAGAAMAAVEAGPSKACTSPMSSTAMNGPGRLSRRRWRQRRKPGRRISSRRHENCCATGSRSKSR